MIVDLRSDTSRGRRRHAPRDGRGRGRRRRLTARTRPSAPLERKVAELLGKQAALFVPSPARSANQSGIRLLVPPGKELVVRLAGAPRACRARRGRPSSAASLPHLGGRPRPARSRAIEDLIAPDAGPQPGCRTRLARSRTLTTRRRPHPAARAVDAVSSRADRRAARCTSTARGCGTRTWQPAARWRAGGAVRHGVGLPVQGPRRAGRSGHGGERRAGSPRRGYGASVTAPGCARPASWPPPAGTRSPITSRGSPTTTPARSPNRRRARCRSRRGGHEQRGADVAQARAVAERPQRKAARLRWDRGCCDGHPPRRRRRRHRPGDRRTAPARQPLTAPKTARTV